LQNEEKKGFLEYLKGRVSFFKFNRFLEALHLIFEIEKVREASEKY